MIGRGRRYSRNGGRVVAVMDMHDRVLDSQTMAKVGWYLYCF